MVVARKGLLLSFSLSPCAFCACTLCAPRLISKARAFSIEGRYAETQARCDGMLSKDARSLLAGWGLQDHGFLHSTTE